ncbi:MAG TPA: hypothetical protein VN704_01950 [Verrucomicrobiae bacterium]|nr:hypothetical protein [Verrucomicrobiae bacterium]
MSEFLITCIKKDESGAIIQVGVNDKIYDVDMIADEIWNNKNSYFINAMGIRVKIFAFRHPETNKPYLSSSTNIKFPNSLNFMSKCK